MVRARERAHTERAERHLCEPRGLNRPRSAPGPASLHVALEALDALSFSLHIYVHLTMPSPFYYTVDSSVLIPV